MKNENLKPEHQDIHLLSVLVGILIGGLVGTVAMLLLAPQTGEKTRGQIQEISIELRDQASEIMEDAMLQVRMDRKEIDMNTNQLTNHSV